MRDDSDIGVRCEKGGGDVARRPPVAGWVRVALLAVAAACGEVERFDVVDRPRLDDYAAVVHPMLIEVGCSRNGRCHTQLAGELRLAPEPDAEDLKVGYAGLRARVNPDAPDESDVLRLLVQGNPAPTHRPPWCFASTESCAYRRLRAWIGWQAEGDPRPGDIACAPEPCP